MRLYRGIKKPYDPAKVKQHLREGGTDFTDCPARALRYAQGSRGVVMVLDVPDEELAPGGRVTEECWLGQEAKRFMAWGKFDAWLTAVLPAKDLRTRLRERGLRNATDEYKSIVLQRIVRDEIRERARIGQSPAVGG